MVYNKNASPVAATVARNEEVASGPLFVQFLAAHAICLQILLD